MDRQEIFRYIEVGSSKSISVDRRVLKDYPGIIREVIIREDKSIQIDFLDKNVIDLGEGEISFYFYYKSYDELISAIEEYTGLGIEQWENYTKTGSYPEIKEANLKDSWENLKVDFVKRKLSFPERYSDYQIRDIYWRALYEGDIRLDDPWEVFEKFLFKMMDADMDG